MGKYCGVNECEKGKKENVRKSVSKGKREKTGYYRGRGR